MFVWFLFKVFVQVTDAVTAPHQLHFEVGGFFVFCFIGYRGPSRERMMESMIKLLLGLCDHCLVLLEAWRLALGMLTTAWRLVTSLNKLLSGKLVPEK